MVLASAAPLIHVTHCGRWMYGLPLVSLCARLFVQGIKAKPQSSHLTVTPTHKRSMSTVKPAENVFDINDIKPTCEDADANGKVLYFSKSLGWHQGYYHSAFRDDVTHWTYLPEEPPSVEDPAEKMSRLFSEWVNDTFPSNCEPAVRMLLRLGYEAGFNRRGRR